MHSSENRAFAIFGRDAQSKNLSAAFPFPFAARAIRTALKQKQIPRAPTPPRANPTRVGDPLQRS